MKTVLLTGATGFIGRHTIPFLIENGYQVHALTSQKKSNRQDHVEWHKTDLFKPVEVNEILHSISPTHLLHFAWNTTPGLYWTSMENLSWVRASLNLLQEFIGQGGTRVVMAGTCAEYDWNYGYCSEHITPVKPASLYGISKHSLQMMLQGAAEEQDLCAAWGRVFFLYGPYEHPSRVVPSIIQALLSGKYAECTIGDQIRDYLYVKDVADAFVSLLDSEITGPVNIGSGKPISIREIIERIGRKIGNTELIRFGAIPKSPSEAPFIVAGVDRLEKELNWHPSYTLDEGLDQTIAWWRTILKNNGHSVENYR